MYVTNSDVVRMRVLSFINDWLNAFLITAGRDLSASWRRPASLPVPRYASFGVTTVYVLKLTCARDYLGTHKDFYIDLSTVAD